MRLVLVALLATLFSCSSADKIQPSHTYQLGERTKLGRLTYTVSEKQWQNQFGSGVDARIPQNRFLLLRFSIQNTGAEEAIVPNTQLQDDAGVSYPEVADGEGVSDWIGNTRQVKAGGGIEGYLFYDVPQKHYLLRVEGEDEKESAFIDIPLSFDSDVPDVTTPIEPDPLSKKK